MPIFQEWLAIAMGRSLRGLTREEYQRLAAEFAHLAAELLPKLEDLANNPDPVAQRELGFRLFDEWAHRLDHAISPGEDFLRFYARASHRLSVPPDGWPNDAPWQYAERHRRYCDFLGFVVASHGLEAVIAFLREAFVGTLPQYQTLERVMNLDFGRSGQGETAQWIKLRFGGIPPKSTAVHNRL